MHLFDGGSAFFFAKFYFRYDRYSLFIVLVKPDGSKPYPVHIENQFLGVSFHFHNFASSQPIQRHDDYYESVCNCNDD